MGHNKSLINSYLFCVFSGTDHAAAAHLLCLRVHAEVEVAAGQADPVLGGWAFVVRCQLLELLQRTFVVPKVEGTVADPLISQLVGVPTVTLKLEPTNNIQSTTTVLIFVNKN